jgi:hypothetical protein
MQVFQVVLQYFMGNALSLAANGKEELVRLQTEMKKKFETAPTTPAGARDDERMKRLAVARTKLFFAPLNHSLGVPPEEIYGLKH